MADFYAPQIQSSPDFLGSYVRGQLAPGDAIDQQQQLQIGAQLVQGGQLNLDQLRLAMQMKRMRMAAAQQFMDTPVGGPGGAQATGGASGGIQNGPQASVSSQPPASQAPASPLDALLDPRRLAAAAQYGQFNAVLSGTDPNKPVADALAIQENARKDQQERTKLELTPQADLFRQFATDPNADRTLLANAQAGNNTPLQTYQHVAPMIGEDPLHPTALSVQRVAAFSHNNIAQRSMGTIAPLPMPNPLQRITGSQGQPLNRDPITGQETLEPGAEAPKYEMKEVWNPATNRMVGKMVQTGGFGFRGAGGAPGAPGTNAGPDFGMKEPVAENTKAAEFANYAIPAIEKLKKLESSGYVLPPFARSAIQTAATSEDTGALHSLMQQESLKHALSPEGQQYMAALMPVLQAAGHSMGGARLTAGQMRANFESLVPVDAGNAEALATINQNRDSFLRGLVGAAGPAAYTPAFKGTVGKLADSYKAPAGSAHPAAIQALLDKYPKAP